MATHWPLTAHPFLNSQAGPPGDAPSFGGYTADTTSTEIADSCPDVNAIAADYEAVITSYYVTRLDMDVEGDSLTDMAGIARRNQALKLVEQWAARRPQPLQVQYTRRSRC